MKKINLVIFTVLLLSVFGCAEDCDCPEPEIVSQDSLTFETAIIGEWYAVDVNLNIETENLPSIKFFFSNDSLEILSVQNLIDANLNQSDLFFENQSYLMNEKDRLMILDHESSTNSRSINIGHYDRDSIVLIYDSPYPRTSDEIRVIELSLEKEPESEF